jgi:uncharacterized membrane protein
MRTIEMAPRPRKATAGRPVAARLFVAVGQEAGQELAIGAARVLVGRTRTCDLPLTDTQQPTQTEDSSSPEDSGAPADSASEGEGEDSAETGSSTQADFATVYALLVSRCAACHEDSYNAEYIDSADASATYAMLLDLTPRSDGSARYVVPGDPDRSLLFEKINPEPADGTIMPPPSSREEALSDDEVALIRDWIAAGAEGP